MKKSWQKYIIPVAILAVILSLSGCAAFELTPGRDGQPQTQIEQILKDVAGGISAVTGIVPGYNAIGGGIAVLLGLIGTSITAVVKNRKNSGALATVIKGVEVASNQYTDVEIAVLKTLEGNSELQAKVKYIFDQARPVKEAIKATSVLVGNSRYLDKQVQKITYGLKDKS